MFLTTPPLGIRGPYGVTVEAKIYGSIVDLELIQNKVDGQYADDYTHVWNRGVNADPTFGMPTPCVS
jgi:hypothetical protein